MPELEDIELLREYAGRNSETAFAELVERHVNLVYSTALRRVGNVHSAQEISQAVFIILARKAKSFSKRTVLSGWLYQTTKLTAANYLRGEIRRQKREQEAFMQSTLNESESEAWTQIAPLLDDAISKLGSKDRDAIVLRFFESKNLHEVGAALGASENAAKMRVNRALEKLRKFFSKRGVALSGALIAGAVSANSVQAAPVGLAATISAAAVKSSAVTASTLTLVKGALKLMAWSKAQTAIVAGVVVLLATGTTIVTVKEIQEYKADDSWRSVRPFDGRVLDRVPPLLEILPAKLPSGGGWASNNKNGKMGGTGVGAETIVEVAYGFQFFNARTILSTELPKNKYYDFIASLPSGNAEALQQEIKKQFGVVGRREMRDTDVLLLEIQNSDASGLMTPDPRRLGPHEESSIRSGAGYYTFRNTPLSGLALNIEYNFGIPVIDQTGLTNRFDFDLKWNEPDWHHRNLDNLKQALVDQLGLELVPTNMPIEMLVMEKAN
jgi:uncharacterized protein (TIGR03435 family)